MADYAEAITAKHVGMREKSAKPELGHITIREGEDGGHIVEHHFEHAGGYVEPKPYPFGEHDGDKPKLPAGHVLTHIAEHMHIPHEVMSEEEEE